MIAPLDPRALLTTDEAAEYIGVSKGRLAQWRSDGVGPAYLKPSAKSVQYRVADIDEWRDATRIEPIRLTGSARLASLPRSA